jgi:acyl carrier protein
MTRQMLENIQSMTAELTARSPVTREEIQDWLAEQIAQQLGQDADEIALTISFNAYGLESVQAMAIAAAGKQRYGLDISPLVIWNYPTIATLSDYIEQSLADEETESFEI